MNAKLSYNRTQLQIWIQLERHSHSWYHFLSLYLSINPWADWEKPSASDIMRAVRSSNCESFSPRSITIWWAKATSPVAVVTRSRRASVPAFGPGICFATVREARPLDSPTKSKKNFIELECSAPRFSTNNYYTGFKEWNRSPFPNHNWTFQNSNKLVIPWKRLSRENGNYANNV